ncbi:MAG: hypothetical protein HC767_09710 [Akkermansiaceae bacterium]|nr:hypothetical protein [Akkermansiaceae bacterium]
MAPTKTDDPIIQYIILRRDLWADQGWPLGPLIAQACHASVAALWLHREDETAQAYVAPESLEHMHKVCSRLCVLQGSSPTAHVTRGASRLVVCTSVIINRYSLVLQHYVHHRRALVQVVLEVKGEVQLNNLAKKLEEEGVLHKVWVEQPEAYPTALATKPYPKSSIAHHFKKLKLC